MQKNQRVPELDGLRGTAILMVVVYHYFQLTLITIPGTWAARLQSAIALGWTGVDLFFVLSGFLIGGILLDARHATNYFQVFYLRRFYRIIPLYVMAITLFPFLANVLDCTWLRIGGTSIPWYAYWTFTQNCWMAHTERFGVGTLAITWSLAIEEQFYLTLPFLVRAFTTEQLNRVVRLGIYLAPLLRIGLGFKYQHNWLAPFALMPCRADALLLGVLAALFIRDEVWKKRLQSKAFGPIVAVLAVGPVIFTIFTPSPDNPIMQSFGYSWMALFYAGVLLYAVSRPVSALSRLLRTPWLMWLGGLAYGVYLLHQTVLGLVFGALWHQEPFINGGYSLLTTLLAVAITLALAALSWQFFEKPFLDQNKASYRHCPTERPLFTIERTIHV
jgi:peptidoglycan/LPS O-acetylase OafA/YrhL